MNSFGMTGIYVLLVAGNAVIAFALWYLRRSFASTDAMKKWKPASANWRRSMKPCRPLMRLAR